MQKMYDHIGVYPSVWAAEPRSWLSGLWSQNTAVGRTSTPLSDTVLSVLPRTSRSARDFRAAKSAMGSQSRDYWTLAEC